MTPVASATAQDTTERSFVVDLQEDGSATVTVTTTFDLTDQNETDAFEQLTNDQQARDRFETNFRNRMAGVASDASNETGREMSISDSTIDLRTDGDTGIVELSVTWDGLAAVDGNQLTVSEPFASSFTPDRAFSLHVPDGYEATTVSPSADSRADGTLTWNAGTSLDGFAVTAEQTDGGSESGASEPTSASTTDDSSGDGPGFGIGLTITALLGVGFLARRRR
ncbi:DUF7345 domain-containing protein [Halorientalis salina]|uniref:DUF7345 domain-containing protein n=1 Tax=Halorientalis salina TaxID=2932266 RepID=UPI00145CEC15|nr:PGF-CTERM sorting domain-containing protein [Halorientalis salina]